MANPHINYATFKSRFGDLGITEWTKYNYLSNYNFGLPAQTEVPSDYLELEYITTTNATYIDTNIVPTANMYIEAEYNLNEIPQSGSYAWIWGTYVNEDTNSTRSLLAGPDLTYANIVTKAGYAVSAEVNRSTGVWYKEAVYRQGNQQVYTLNGTNYTRDVVDGAASNATIIIGNVRNTTSGAVMKFKSFRINGVMNLKPVRRLSDGVIGMYDTVSGQFFQNRGQDSFTAGPMKQRYVRVEYVQFNGDDTIDTGLTTKHATYVQDADIQFTQFNNGEQQYLGADYGVYWGINDSSHFAQAYNRDLSPNKVADTNQHHFVSRINTQESESELYIDGVKYSAKRPTTYQVGYSIYVGYAFSTVPVYAKVYSYKIYEDNVLLRDFVPVYDLVTEKYGLFDMVEGKFYASVNNKLTGPWDFVMTDDIEWQQGTYDRFDGTIDIVTAPVRTLPVYIDGYTTLKDGQAYDDIKDLKAVYNSNSMQAITVQPGTLMTLHTFKVSISGKYIQYHKAN